MCVSRWTGHFEAARAYLFAHAPLVTNVQGLSEAKCQEAQALIRVYKRIDDAAFRDAMDRADDRELVQAWRRLALDFGSESHPHVAKYGNALRNHTREALPASVVGGAATATDKLALEVGIKEELARAISAVPTLRAADERARRAHAAPDQLTAALRRLAELEAASSSAGPASAAPSSEVKAEEAEASGTKRPSESGGSVQLGGKKPKTQMATDTDTEEEDKPASVPHQWLNVASPAAAAASQSADASPRGPITQLDFAEDKSFEHLVQQRGSDGTVILARRDKADVEFATPTVKLREHCDALATSATQKLGSTFQLVGRKFNRMMLQCCWGRVSLCNLKNIDAEEQTKMDSTQTVRMLTLSRARVPRTPVLSHRRAA